MDRTRFSACRPKTDGIRINGSGIKAVDAENCHINIMTAVGIYFVSVTKGSNINGNQPSLLELDCSDIAAPDAGISYLIGFQTSSRICIVDDAAPL